MNKFTSISHTPVNIMDLVNRSSVTIRAEIAAKLRDGTYQVTEHYTGPRTTGSMNRIPLMGRIEFSIDKYMKMYGWTRKTMMTVFEVITIIRRDLGLMTDPKTVKTCIKNMGWPYSWKDEAKVWAIFNLLDIVNTMTCNEVIARLETMYYGAWYTLRINGVAHIPVKLFVFDASVTRDKMFVTTRPLYGFDAVIVDGHYVIVNQINLDTVDVATIKLVNMTNDVAEIDHLVSNVLVREVTTKTKKAPSTLKIADLIENGMIATVELKIDFRKIMTEFVTEGLTGVYRYVAGVTATFNGLTDVATTIMTAKEEIRKCDLEVATVGSTRHDGIATK